VSQQIQALESEVRGELFDRATRPIMLNGHGLQMLEAARTLVRDADNIIDAISGRAVSGTFTIGSVRSSALSLLPLSIVALKADYPDLRIKLQVANTDELLKDVMSGRLDCAMVAEYSGIPSALRWQPFINEPLLVIGPNGTPKMSGFDMLSKLPYVRFNSKFRLAQIIETELAKTRIVPNLIAEIDTIASVVSCVIHGLGVSVVPWIALRDIAAPIVAVQFGEPQILRPIGLLERRSGTRAQIIDRLHQNLARLSDPYGIPR
jgi:DNA-binding transcriptional LysR family regulator